MADPMIIHGDAEALIIDILQNQTPELDPYNHRVASDLRGYTNPMRWIKATQEGAGMAIWNVLHKPRIDVEVRAERRSVARDMCAIAIGSIFRSVGTSGFGATLSSVKMETGMALVPDKEEEASYRYIFSVRLVCTVDPTTAVGPESP